MLVLAVNQEASRDDTKPKVVSAVTLELSPPQAEKLDLARSIGTLSLVLRNQLDVAPARTAGARRNDLIAGPAASPAAPVRSAPRHSAPSLPVAIAAPAPVPARSVEVIKGMQKSAVDL